MSTAVSPVGGAGVALDTGESSSAMRTIARGIELSPELKDGFRGTLVVAYRKATIALADEVVFLTDGHIDDQGTHAELLARNPAYADLVNAYEQEAAERDGDPDGEPGPGGSTELAAR